MGLLDSIELDPETRSAMQSLSDVSPEMRGQAMNNAMINAGLGMVMNNGGMNGRQSLYNALAGGIGGFANGYQESLDRAQRQQLQQLQTAMTVSRFNQEMASTKARQAALANLSPEDRQMIAMGVSPDKMLEARQSREYLAGRPGAGPQMVPVELPQLSERQGTGNATLDVSTPEKQRNIQRQIAELRASGNHADADGIVAALVKQGSIAPPMRQVMPDANALAQYAVRGQLAGVKGASADYNYAKDFLKPDWQQVDNGGQIQFINKNAGQLPVINKTETPEIQWQRQKFGIEQQSGNANQKISREAELRKEFSGLQTSQDWWSVQPVLQTAREAAKVDNKAADLNLIYAVAKLYDPGSVVRESETTMQVKSGSPAEQFQGMFNSIAGGGRLTPDQRQKIMQQVESRAAGYEDAYNYRAGQYRTIAERSGVDPENIITTAPNKSRREEPAAPSSDYSVNVGGKTYYFPDQKAMNNFKLKAGVK